MTLINGKYWTEEKLVRLTRDELLALIANLEQIKHKNRRNSVTVAATIRRARFVLHSVGNVLHRAAPVVKYSDVTGQAIGNTLHANTLSQTEQQSYYQGLLAIVQVNKYLAQLMLSKNHDELLSLLKQTQQSTVAQIARSMLDTSQSHVANSHYVMAA